METYEVIEKDPEGNDRVVVINKQDVKYVGILKNQIYFEMHNGQTYYLPDSMADMELIFPESAGFVRVDRMSIVNQARITFFDEKEGDIYFDEPVVHKKNFVASAPSYRKRLIARLKKD
ncbi:LytTR family transcriptional regulator DNA-binding domain-containing protein [Paenibacillus chitinolyticus]|uniref:LytTR family transcriptional regulator DNA-binding domain-containing protein n=1 Tax=Paenibacillus chitinolyticus TaxID=79263 RepID=UPI0036668AE2